MIRIIPIYLKYSNEMPIQCVMDFCCWQSQEEEWLSVKEKREWEEDR